VSGAVQKGVGAPGRRSDNLISMPRDARILVVDDDPDTLALLRSILIPRGYTIHTAEDGLQALACLELTHYDLVLTDVCMPGMDGLELLQHIQRRFPHTRVVVLTAHTNAETVVRSLKDKAFSYFSKPFSSGAIAEMVAQALDWDAWRDDIEILSARPDWVALQLRCRLELADRLVQFFRELNVGIGPEQQERVATAFRELLVNAIEHGGHLDPQEKIQVSYMRLSRAIIYCIRDPGNGFSFKDLPHAAISNTPDAPLGHSELREQMGMRPGGFGIFLTRKMADEVLYNEKGNEVMLVKYLKEPDHTGR
jgi:two-component system, OmpR family, response regulator